MKLWLVCLISSVYAEGFFKDTAHGWHWYEALLVEEEDAVKAPEASVTPQTPLAQMAAYREALENKLAKAILEPTSVNIMAYQVAQQELMERSERFGKAWMEVVFKNPQLDYSLVSPVNQKARHIKYDLEKQKVAQTIKGLAEDYGLFFFFSSQCAYCHEFAPIVKAFADHYGWQVLAISIDGGKVAEFAQSVADNGLFSQWRVEVLPALFAVNPKTGHVIPIAYGLSSIDQMETRIMTLVEHKA